MQNWEIKTLQEVCIMKITDGTHQTPKYCEKEDGGYPFISSKNVTKEYIDWSDIKYIIPELHETLYKRIAPQKEDVLLAKNGTTGVAAIVDDDRIFDIYVTLAILRPNTKIIYPQYLLKIINSPICKVQFNTHLKGSGVPNLHLEEIQKVTIPLPPLEEQKRIVKILDEKFAMLETVKANAKANLQNAKDLFQSQLTKAFSNTTWEKKRLGEICSKIGSGATPKGGKDSYKSEGIYLVRSMNVYDNEFIYDKLACLDDNQAYELRNVELQEDDVLFNITGASVCRCCVLPTDVLPARVNQHVSILRPDHKILNPLFLCYSMIGPYHEELYKMACSGGSTRQAITKKQLEDFEVYVPSLEEQKIMIDRIDSLSEKVRSLEALYTKQLANCDELKQSFLAKAFNGEL